MWQRVSNWFKSRRQPDYANPTAQMTLGPVLGHRCRLCNGELWSAGHEFAQFAITVAKEGSTARLEEFLAAADCGDWAKLASFHDFEGAHNAHVAFAVRCGTDGRVYMELVVNPAELWEGPRWIDEHLCTEDSAALVAMISRESWISFVLKNNG